MKLVDRETLLREREERRRVSMAAWPACWPLEGEPRVCGLRLVKAWLWGLGGALLCFDMMLENTFIELKEWGEKHPRARDITLLPLARTPHPESNPPPRPAP